MFMERKTKNFITYKREKNKVEITGNPKDTKGLMWFDIISFNFLIFLVIILAFIVSKNNFLQLIWEWMKKQIPFMILFVAVADLFLSG